MKSLIEHTQSIEHENMLLKEKLVHTEAQGLVSQALDIKGAKVVVAQVDKYSVRELRLAADELRNRLGSSVVLLGTVVDGKVSFIAMISKDLTSKLKAGELVNYVASFVGGKGGGRPDMAQAGGTKPEGLPQALAEAPKFIEEHL